MKSLLITWLGWVVLIGAIALAIHECDPIAANGARDERRAFQPCAVDAKGGVTCPAEEGRKRP
jgi:hypothetical protein